MTQKVAITGLNDVLKALQFQLLARLEITIGIAIRFKDFNFIKVWIYSRI